jgi:hypothetical protein
VRARPGTRASAGTSQPPIPPTDLGSGATCRSRAPQRTARACCMSPTVAHKPGCVIPAGGHTPLPASRNLNSLQPVSASTDHRHNAELRFLLAFASEPGRGSSG